MLAKCLAFLVVLIGLFVGVAYLQHSHYDVTRTAIIDAPPHAVFEQVNNLRKWQAWSPWAKLDDPNQKVGFSGPEAGKDARMDWSGSIEAGEGSMLITESRPPERVVLDLELLKPLKTTSTAEFMLTPQNNGTQTEVRWNAQGQKDLIAKAMGLLVNRERFIGESFEKSLANMKNLLEPKTQAAPSPAGPPMPQPATAPKAQPTTGAASPAAVSEAAPAPKLTPSPATSAAPAAAEGAKVSVDVKKSNPPASN